MHRIVSGLALPALLLALVACGSDEPAPETTKAREGAIGDITVTGDFGAQPTVDFKAPVAFPSSEFKTVIDGPGKGDEVTDQSTVAVNYVGINASDGTEFDSSWPAGAPATFETGQVIKGFSEGLQGAQAGDRLLLAIASEDGYDPVGNGTSIAKGDSLVFVVDVEKVTNPAPPKTLTKADVPKLELDKSGDPEKFVAAKDTPATAKELGVYVSKQGKGALVEPDATLTVDYLGQIYPDGEVFDESYSKGKPVSFPLADVIPGWQQGLVGQTEGSRVVLVIPSELGYGAVGQGDTIPPDSDLIFVIDIVKAK